MYISQKLMKALRPRCWYPAITDIMGYGLLIECVVSGCVSQKWRVCAQWKTAAVRTCACFLRSSRTTSVPVPPACSCWRTTRPAETVRRLLHVLNTHAHTHTPMWLYRIPVNTPKTSRTVNWSVRSWWRKKVLEVGGSCSAPWYVKEMYLARSRLEESQLQ